MKRYALIVIGLAFIVNIKGASPANAYYNKATGKDEIILISRNQEVNMGKSIDREIRKKYKINEDPALVNRINDMGQKIAAVCDRRDIEYHFAILDYKDEINAFSVPGGYVYIFTGLLNATKSNAQVAAVLAHEIAHVAARHSVKRLQLDLGMNALLILSSQAPATDETRQRSYQAIGQLMMAYSREDEILADKLGVKYLKASGFDQNSMAEFLKILLEEQRKAPIRPYMDYRSHPYLSQRIAKINSEISGTVSFTDFINDPTSQQTPQ